ncbi:MAG: glycine cleavage system protein H [Acidobacteriota bacterium]
MVAILVILTIVVAVAVDALVVANRRRAGATAPHPARGMAQPRPPQGVFLDASHSWARITSDGSLRVGVDEFLTEALGEVDRVGVPGRGTQVKRGEALLHLQVKGREIIVPSPASGEVMTVNSQVVEKPWLVARDPYGVGWAVALWTRDLQEAIRPLRIGASVAGFLRQEMMRLADFLSASSLRRAEAPLLADGGMPRHGAVMDLDDAGLAAFQDEFLRPGREG